MSDSRPATKEHIRQVANLMGMVVDELLSLAIIHEECEQEECARAHREFMGRVGEAGVREFLRSNS